MSLAESGSSGLQSKAWAHRTSPQHSGNMASHNRMGLATLESAEEDKTSHRYRSRTYSLYQDKALCWIQLLACSGTLMKTLQNQERMSQIPTWMLEDKLAWVCMERRRMDILSQY